MCEVTDVVNSNAGQNNKEKKSIMKLGCINEVPQDDIDRYIVTSIEYGDALASERRKWDEKFYRYQNYPTQFSTRILKVISE